MVASQQLSRDQVLVKVKVIIANSLAISVVDVQEGALLVGDLRADGLDLLDIMHKVNVAFECELLTVEEIGRIRDYSDACANITVRDIVDRVMSWADRV